jgi:hypothetical protein
MALDRVALNPVSDALVGARVISFIFIRVFIDLTPDTTYLTDTDAYA